MEKKIIVLAGTHQQFEEWLNENGMTDSQAVYGYHPDRIRGIQASKVVTTGTFWERKDAGDLEELALTRIRD